ncbi:hypothetical protein CYMTET_35336 [Cymbomonas tetramitiformis]|uniref:Uncharacterized protein n=1 Tax=Cymbomonas tetramitiformis TaxID=36881 RepID=A0AAE0KP02_9CHLO|nr:hypothetical protein CYMTET_35336 [Cymbomonas tetramitiformis]|eukprot:gene17684-21067_t
MEADTIDPLYDRDPSAEALRFLEEDSDDDTLSNAFLGVLDRREVAGSGKGSPDALSLRNDDEESVDRSIDETMMKSFTNDIFDGSLSPRVHALQKQPSAFTAGTSVKGGDPAKKGADHVSFV